MNLRLLGFGVLCVCMNMERAATTQIASLMISHSSQNKTQLLVNTQLEDISRVTQLLTKCHYS